MKLTIRDDSTNYAANVIKLPVLQQVEGLDNLRKVEVFGNDCLVGKDSDPNTLYLFFPAGCVIENAFLSKNNLFRDAQLNSDRNQKGFFEPNGRVKGLKLRGVVSNGFVTPVSFLTDGVGEALKEGDEFTTIDGVDICRKFTIQRTEGTPGVEKQGKISNKLTSVLIPNQFRFHKETEHFAKHLNALKPDDIIVITDKWHGSSCILSKVFISKPLNRWQKLINKLLPNAYPTRQLGYVYSSGKPKSNVPKNVLNADGSSVFESSNGSFYNSNIWERAFNQYKHTIEDGISLYGELVGFEESGGYIQKGYDYKCNAHDYRFMVYRITYTKPDGSVIEFGWQQIKDYCDKYGIEHVKELYFGNVFTYIGKYDDQETQDWRTDMMHHLMSSYNMECKCEECNNDVPAEGIVIRRDGHLSTYDAYKLKSKLFVLGESNETEPESEA